MVSHMTVTLRMIFSLCFFALIKSIGQRIRLLGVFYFILIFIFSFGGDSVDVESHSPSTDASKTPC